MRNYAKESLDFLLNFLIIYFNGPLTKVVLIILTAYKSTSETGAASGFLVGWGAKEFDAQFF